MFSFFRKKTPTRWDIDRLEHLFTVEAPFVTTIRGGEGLLLLTDDRQPTAYVTVRDDGLGVKIIFEQYCPANIAGILTKFLLGHMPLEVSEGYITASATTVTQTKPVKDDLH